MNEDCLFAICVYAGDFADVYREAGASFLGDIL